jgi:acyl-CoA synthetase (AMP-forming)/AMP-acid ligase II
MNSQLLIHKDFSIYTFKDLILINKDQILNNIQYWKNILVEKNVKKLTVIDHITFDSVSIFFASLELGIEVITANREAGHIAMISQLADIVLMSDNIYKIVNPEIDNLLVYTESPIRSIEYIPNNIDLDKIVLSGFTSGSTGNPKLISHSARTIISASTLASNFYSTKENFFSHSNFNHLGIISMGVLGPIIAGVHLMTSRHEIHDLIFYASRQMVDKALLFDINIIDLKNNYSVDGLLDNIEIITGGKIATSSFVDWMFMSGAKRIYSVYGASECLPPVMTKIFNSPDDGNLDELGIVLDCYKTKIVNGQLYLQGPGVSERVETHNGFYNTGDYVLPKNNTFQFCGRQRLIDGQSKTEAEYKIMIDSLLNQHLDRRLKKFIFSDEYKLIITTNELTIVLNNHFDLQCIDKELLAEAIMKWCNLKLNLTSGELKFSEIKAI